VGIAITIVSVVGEGRPSFWLWYGLVTVVFALVNVFIPTGNALAMEAMGHLAGTASAVIGTLSLLGGSLFGMLADSTLENSVTPMSAFFLAYGAMAMLSVLWAEHAESPAMT
jgi:DHA1 family bicyclomycin/chloramphenicol resistance-like MFS transporter